MTSYFKDQIDRLTEIINSAVGRNKADKPLSPAPKQSSQDRDYQRLGEMILKMQDGVLEHKYVSRLGKWLSCDERALKYYVEFNQLSAMLRSLYSKKQITEEISLAKN